MSRVCKLDFIPPQLPTCNEYEKLVTIVNAAAGTKAQELSPVNVIDGPAPPMWTDQQQADWDRARDQHVELAKAAGIKPPTKALLTDACRGQANVRWIERQGKIPDGPSVGEPFRLQEFQREVIRGIYSDPRYWAAVKLVVKKGRAA